MKETKKKTSELLELMKSSHHYADYASEIKEHYVHMSADRAISSLIGEKGLKRSDVIARSGIETHYGYQILSGAKKPSRDKIVMFCRGAEATFEEVQQLLKIVGEAPLYLKNERDNVIAFGFIKGLSVIELNSLLYEADLELLL